MTITAAPPVVHWNDDAGLPHCGARTEVGETSHGHRDRDRATCPACKPEPGTLVHVRPHALLLERNIRETRLDPDFVASVAAEGVLEPITAVLNKAGQLVVRFGHRRTLAAAQADLAAVPVYVAGDDDHAVDAEIDRVVRQYDENTQRSGLTAAEQAGVVDQLVLLGVPADQLVKKHRFAADQVDQAMKVRGSMAAQAAATHVDVTLEQAAAIAEFEDSPEDAEALTKVALESPQQFEHAAQRRRDERAREFKKDELRAQLQVAGVKIVDAPDWSGKGPRPLTALLEKPGGTQLTAKNHADCPGHVGWVSARFTSPEIGYGCRDPKKHGHHDKDRGSGAGGRTTNDDLTPEEREKKSKARKLVIENNKAWASATTVRREWLATFAKGKTPPKGAAAFISWAIARHGYYLHEHTASTLAAEWAGVKAKPGTGRPDFEAATTRATEGRALLVVLVQVLAAFEEKALDNMTWRRSGKTEWHGKYLTFLEAAGYPLSDVEKYAVSTKTVA